MKSRGDRAGYSPEKKRVRPACFRRLQPVLPPLGCIEGPQPFDFLSAGGDMRVAEERLKAATKEAMIK